MKPTATETLNACPVCNETKIETYLELADYSISKEPFSIAKCSKCGFLFTNPRPNKEHIGPYYESEDYISHSNSSKGLMNTIYKQVRHYTIAKKVAMMMRIVDGKKTLLDYGCGTGEFLNVMQLNKWEVKGIEPGDGPRNQAISNYKLAVTPPDSIFSMENESFSIITMWHVLEHIHDLNETLAQLRKMLTKTGKMVIAVPNCEAKDVEFYGKHWAGWDVPRHLYHFSEDTLSKLLSKHQLKITDIKPMAFDSFYVDLLSEKYRSGSMNPVRAFWNGFRSNLAGVANINKYASLIYIVSKE